MLDEDMRGQMKKSGCFPSKQAGCAAHTLIWTIAAAEYIIGMRVCVILILMRPFIYFRGWHRAARSQLLNLDVWPRDTRAGWLRGSSRRFIFTPLCRE